MSGIGKVFSRILDLYVDGFRHMTVGKTLWMVVIIKLAVIFLILKVFFFPDFIRTHSPKGQEADFVERQILPRG